MPQMVNQLSLLSPEGAFLLSSGSERIMVISDLHIGWEVALAEEGVHVPSQTKRLFEKLKGLLFSQKPDRLVILGDVKHTVSKIDFEEWRDVPWFFEETCKVVPRVQVVPGNHDGDLEALLPESVELLSPRGLVLGDVGLFHGHSWPDTQMLGCTMLVAGHVHPVVVFSDPIGFRITKQVWILASCNKMLLAKCVLKGNNVSLKKDENPQDVLRTKFGSDLKAESFLIMPSFNDYLGGQAVNVSSISRNKKFEGFIGPVLRSGSVNLDEAETYLLDGTFLGSIKHLRKLS
ncbi:MAG: metallophosphoesterase [Candidatus Bathyarchaeia archaeon]